MTAKKYGSANWLLNGKSKWQAHCLSYTFYNGTIPDNNFVCHHCDNPSCINPNHLFLGTPKDNMDDMNNKGRGNYTIHPEGSIHPNSIFTDDQIRSIRADKRYATIIAKELGCNFTTIYDIKNKKSYKNVH